MQIESSRHEVTQGGHGRGSIDQLKKCPTITYRYQLDHLMLSKLNNTGPFGPIPTQIRYKLLKQQI